MLSCRPQFGGRLIQKFFFAEKIFSSKPGIILIDYKGYIGLGIRIIKNHHILIIILNYFFLKFEFPRTINTENTDKPGKP